MASSAAARDSIFSAMTRRSPSTSRLLGFGGPLILALALAAAQLGCYRPGIVDGGLRCNLEAGSGKASCPEGFKCESSSGTCKRHPNDGGPDVKPDVPPDVPNDGPMDAPVECLTPRANCTATPDAGLCDPYCQTGCGCLEKCSINTAGALTCNQLKGGQVRYNEDPCEVQAPGSQSQIDQCAPGLFCLEDNCTSGTGNGRCHQFCRTDGECASAACNRDAGGGFKFCDATFVDCIPLPGSANAGCPAGGILACWISTSDVSKTVCDCQFSAALHEGDVCTRSRECFVGLVCAPNPLGTKVCARVCRLGGPASDCPTGACQTLTDNGKTNTTFGFCR
jgi:hypothetical protein